jgi:gliding motility-associated-like protein
VKTIFIFILSFFIHLSLNAQSDCPDAIIVCGNESYRGLNATGVGALSEITPDNACESAEHNSLWLKILIKNGGTLGFVLTPDSPDLVVDFDFWIFGPNVSCDSIGTAVRCSTTNPLQARLTHNLTGMDNIQEDIAEGPGPDGNAFINWMNVNDNDTYYLIIDRPVGASDFSIRWTGTATFHDVPVFNNPNNIPLDMQKCDADAIDDQSTAFDLTVYDDMFIGSQTHVALTYHESSNDVLTGQNPIRNPSSYRNTSSLQTIYLRMTNTVTGCFATESFTIELTNPVTAGEPEDIELCDIDRNGITEFNLAANDSLIKNGAAGTRITYYTSRANAEAKRRPIGPLYQNETPYSPQEIWARLENISGCYGHALKSFTITVVPLPQFRNPQNISIDLSECDGDTVDDNSTAFNLTTHAGMFTGNLGNMQLSWYEDSRDAETGTDPITTPETYVNTSNPQTIYMRLTDTITGCFNTSSFEIKIADLVAGTPPNIKLCDTDNNGIRDFNLSDNDSAIKNNVAGTEVTYYISEQNAIDKVDPIGPIYQNQIPYSAQQVWARLEYTTGCFGYSITSFTINVEPLPVFNNPQNININLSQCDADTVDDSSTAFNLTTHAAMFRGSQANMVMTYYTSIDNLEDGINAIANPSAYANTSSPQTIYVKMTNRITGCFDVMSFTIEIVNIITPGDPQDIELCDAAENGLQQFDLSQNDALVINNNPDTLVTYHASRQDAENNTNAIGPLYTNTIPYAAQQIWARLQKNNGCFGYSLKSFTIKILPLPTFNNPDGKALKLEKCDADAADDKSTLFDLTANENVLLGNQSNIDITYYLSAAEAQAGINALVNPQAFANTVNPQTVYVRMLNTSTGCLAMHDLTLEIINPVVAGQPHDLALCDVKEDGLQLFNLAANSTMIKNGATNAAVTYYLSEADAENEVNRIGDYYQNRVPYVVETIWARLENITGCYGHDVIPFTITVMPLPDIVFNFDVIDFTVNENAIHVVIDNPENYEYAIDGVNFSDNTIFDHLVPGPYTITIRSKNHCKTVTGEVVILNYPKFFTPNHDGINEYWTIPYLSLLPDAQVYIFDRYGKLITGFTGNYPGWDGTYNGHNLPASDYWFVLELKGGRTVKGHFSLLR